MAALVIATGQFDKDKELRMPIADISWHSATGREAHTIQDSVHCFGRLTPGQFSESLISEILCTGCMNLRRMTH
jgi:hypothetical protein